VQKPDSYPTIPELGQRIIKNIKQARGFLDELEAETQDAHKIGPGTAPEVWSQLSRDLNTQLAALEISLGKIDWQAGE